MAKTIGSVPDSMDIQQLALHLLEEARAESVDLAGPDGLLSGLTKTVLDRPGGGETEHLGFASCARRLPLSTPRRRGLL
ncbi:hypothetical protein [Micromonospora sediminicola]|uniref:hypothetical protein n=1 Tax=Micromonospora sediminicola TaxID=946078 RepID=UPI00378DA782